jgi:hypothetical protein
MGQRPGQRPTQGDEKSLRPATTLYRTVALSFVIPSEAEGSAVPRTFRGHVFRQSAPQRRDLCVDASSWKCFSTERRFVGSGHWEGVFKSPSGEGGAGKTLYQGTAESRALRTDSNLEERVQ